MDHIVAIGRQDNLIALAATIRTAHAGVTLAATNLVEHALAAGDALIAAKAALKIDVGHGHWLAWLKNECDLSERQAQKYMTVARGRGVLEANPTRGADLTLTATLKLLPSKKTPPVTGQIPHARGISNRKAQKLTRHDVFAWFDTASVVEHQHLFDGLGSRVVAAAIPPDWNMRLASAGESVGQITAQQRDARPLPTLEWKTATAEQRTAFIARIPICELLATLSREQRLEIEDRIDGLRATQAKPIAAVTHH